MLDNGGIDGLSSFLSVQPPKTRLDRMAKALATFRTKRLWGSLLAVVLLFVMLNSFHWIWGG